MTDMKKYTVYILEENKDLLNNIKESIIKTNNFTVIGTSDNATNCLNYLSTNNCDLLIIDDLGTELTNSFTNSELFNILNTRLLSGKKTIISTNLSPMQLGSNYAQRIFSRIFDRFKMVKFIGKDLRWESKQ